MSSAPVRCPGDPPVELRLAREHGLSSDEWQRILVALGRTPSYAELGVLAAMWSEHCSYKSSAIHLARLPTTGARVIHGPGENAGVVDLGDGFAAVFKMESHNHPSFIEPRQGAATGVGGILRDVFAMGARPIASLDLLRFGRPGLPKTAALLRGVVDGIGSYGNCIGVPTVGGELAFDAAFDGNVLVNVFSCGVAPVELLCRAAAPGAGNVVLYVGAKTGRDGIHGATMASAELRAEGPSRLTTVQVGDPFYEKLLLEACLEARGEDLLLGLQDMGAAGLTSSSVEMASRAGQGLELDLDELPRRALGMTPYELLLSESQERMLLVPRPGAEERIGQICAHWGLDVARIGRVTDTGRWVVRATPGRDPLAPGGAERNPQVVCDLPVRLLVTDAPRYDRPRVEPGLRSAHGGVGAGAVEPDEPDAGGSWTDTLLELLGSPNIGSRAWLWRQFDHIVRGGTLVGPGADAAVVRVPCERHGARLDKLLAFAVDAPTRLCALDPWTGGALAVAEACRNLVCVGAEPLGVTDCLNFGSPERPAVMGQFVAVIEGMAAACRALGVPVVSGNVSFYNETDGRAVLPTPAVAAVGLVERATQVVRPHFRAPGRLVLLLGARRGGPLGGSEHASLLARAFPDPGIDPVPPTIDLDLEVRLQSVVLGLARAEPTPLVESLHDVSDGGLAVALAECCVLGRERGESSGAELELPSDEPVRAALFGEAPSRVVATVVPDALEAVRARAAAKDVPLVVLGVTGGDRLRLRCAGVELLDAPCGELASARQRCLTAVVGDGDSDDAAG